MCEGEKTGSRWLHAAEKKDLRHRTSRYDSIFSHPDFQKRAQADAQHRVSKPWACRAKLCSNFVRAFQTSASRCASIGQAGLGLAVQNCTAILCERFFTVGSGVSPDRLPCKVWEFADLPSPYLSSFHCRYGISPILKDDK